MQWLAWPAWLWPGVSGTVGQTTLTVEHLAVHAHPMNASGASGGTNRFYIYNLGSAWSYETGEVGGSKPHTHALDGASGEASGLPPYYALSYIMRTS